MEELQTRTQLTLGEAASGSIEPAGRNLDKEKLEQFERDVLSDKFDVAVAEGIILPCGCIDGRCPHADEAFNPVPNAAGGTLTMVVGELLTDGKNVASTAENSEDAVASFIEYLKTTQYADQVGGHTGPQHGNPEASGCGANDKLRGIMRQIAEKSDVIAATLDKLGVPVSNEAFAGIVGKAQDLSEREGYFTPGVEVAETLQEASLEGNCPALVGEHNELLIRINTVEGTTIDRRAIEAEYGEDFQVFNVDLWAIKNAADTLSETPEEAEEKFAAMVVYQLATALELCGPSMRAVVR